MLEASRKRSLTNTLCWGITNNGSDFARIGTQEGDLLNGFVHEDPYKTRLLGSYLYITDTDAKKYFSATWYPVMHKNQKLETVFRFGSVETKHGVVLQGIKNIPGMLPTSSTLMFANNIFNLFAYLAKDGKIKLDYEDEIVKGILVCENGKLIHAGAREAMGL